MEVTSTVRTLVADDDDASRRLVEHLLRRWGHAVVTAKDGNEAFARLVEPQGPDLAILDWQMPGYNGPEVCRAVRELTGATKYLILLTARGDREDILQGLDAGANDYIVKPFDAEQLKARAAIGLRTALLQVQLTERVAELEAAITEIKRLHGLLPICCYCKKIRDDGNYWREVEEYVAARTEAKFSHGVCPDCFSKLFPDALGDSKPTL